MTDVVAGATGLSGSPTQTSIASAVAWPCEAAAELVELYDRVAPPLLGLCSAILGGRDEALAVVEECFAALLADVPANPHQWLLTEARRRAVARHRARGRHLRPTTDDSRWEDRFGLSSEERTVLDLVYWQGNTVGEVARRLGLPPERVHRLLRLAMSRVEQQTEQISRVDWQP